jgi:hypothetical protein
LSVFPPASRAARDGVYRLGPAAKVKVTAMATFPRYSRYLLEGCGFPFRAHCLTFDGAPRPRMLFAADPVTLELDFSTHTTRPDDELGRIYIGRPGFHLSSICALASQWLGPSCAMSGNNLGYWPNQFALIRGELVYKRARGLFCDPGKYLDGTYPFVAQQTDGSFGLLWLRLERQDDRVQIVDPCSDQVAAVSAGVSGYPLLAGGESVWATALEHAWDPKLLYEVGHPATLPRAEVLRRLRDAHDRGAALERHGLTLLALTRDAAPLVCVVEEHADEARGVSVEEAATLMLDLGALDAIVLGGKGDAQLVTWEEGVIARPLISAHDRESAREIMWANPVLDRPPGWLERPVPTCVVLGPA